MLDLGTAVHVQTERQLAHWEHAAARLALDDLASPAAWGQLESYLGVALRKHLQGVIDRLRAEGRAVRALHETVPAAIGLAVGGIGESTGGGGAPAGDIGAPGGGTGAPVGGIVAPAGASMAVFDAPMRPSPAVLPAALRDEAARADVRRRLLAFERHYLRAETTLDFFADAINARTNAQTGALLKAADTLAHRAMAQLLDAIGKPTPVALTYLDKGRGAAILKAGLRLWDGGQTCPVAVIKITHHNLLQPTALIHEAGHQVAHIAGWNDELATVLDQALQGAGASSSVANTWAGWASEIAADTFAFAHTGYASLAALHDVLDAGPAQAFRFIPGDPHPLSYLRVLLVAQMCRHAFGGAGPWDALAAAWQALRPLALADADVRALVRDSLPHLPLLARVCLEQPLRAFGGRALRSIVMPERVSPRALDELAARIGPALFTSAHWLWSEPLRIVALTGLRAAAAPRDFQPILELQRQSMLRLGGALQTA